MFVFNVAVNSEEVNNTVLQLECPKLENGNPMQDCNLL